MTIAKKNELSGASAYQLILAQMENGMLRPGSRLREAELAAQLGLSRTPVREALKQLETEGLVAHQAHLGAVVSQLDYTAVTELYFMRELLEGAAARLAAIHATPTEIEVLHEMIATDRTLYDQPQELVKRNKLFHQQIYNASRNRFLIRSLANMRTTLMLMAGVTLSVADRGSVSIDEHEATLKAIAARDPDAAEAAARTHIRRAFKVRLGIQNSQSV
ncbi:MAG: GntR family transcriptional regulator [Sphingobium sp. 66-54]|nr:MAG: GntR family transcriptional regulator [Sphingobium sp. 66-54]